MRNYYILPPHAREWRGLTAALTYFGNFEAYFWSIFAYTKNKILLVDLPANENSDVSFTPHKTTKNTTSFLAFMKNSHLKWEEIFKINLWKCSKSLISNEKKLKLFPQK